jgi:aldehyde dehydrogenase (NAD+)
LNSPAPGKISAVNEAEAGRSLQMTQLTNEDVLIFLDEHKKFFETGETKSIDFRIRQLRILRQAIKANEELIITAMYQDLHKSRYEAFTTEIGLLYTSIGMITKNLKKWAKPQRVPTPLLFFGGQSYIYREPYGTVLIIGPFNYPMNLVFEPLIGAISGGNCAVIKPAQMTPNVSKIIAKIINENFGKNYIRVIEGDRQATAELINAPFDYLFFTGSVGTGKMVMAAAAKNLVPVTLELGGKSPCIVDETANIDLAAKKLAWAKFSNAGQTCAAPDYVYVHKQVKKQFLDNLRQHIVRFYSANPKENKDFGRIVNVRHTERLAQLIDRDKVVIGGDYDIENRYIAPTVLDRVGWDDAVMADEIFGPILPVLEFESLDTMIGEIKSKPKPLALYLFTESKAVEKKIIDNISYGGGCINDAFIQVGNPYLPFGGVGASGIGAYHGRRSFETFSHTKSILNRKFNLFPDMIYPPSDEKKLSQVRKFLR